MAKNTDVSERIDEMIKYLGVNRNSFAKSLGYDRSQAIYDIINGKSKPSFDFFDRFLNTEYSEYINIEWLIVGRGGMVKSQKNIAFHSEEDSGETRPRIPINALAGSLAPIAGGKGDESCERIPLIKAFAQYDFTILASGNSMNPEYCSGDELACIYIKDTSFIQWGRVHVVDTVQGILVKRIFDAGDSIMCRSENKDYPEFNVSKSQIYGIALVVGVVRRY